MRFRFALASVLACAALVAGCGGPSAPAHCSAPDYAMQCAKPKTLGVSPVVGARGVQGVDFAWSKPTVSWLRAAGARFAAGYVSDDSSKNLSRLLVDEYHAAGIATVVIWESTQTRALDGFAAGASDARAASSQAAALGMPSNRPIYFAVDFDTSLNPGVIVPYFQGVRSVLGSRAGGYGGLASIRELFNTGLISYGWQTAAWSGGVWDSRARLQQFGFGASLDWDRAVSADYGQWPYSPVPPLPVCFHRRESAARCAAARARVASDLRAVAASRRAEASAARQLSAHGCVTPYRRDVCVDLGHEQIPVFRQRVRWFTAAAASIEAAN